MNNKFFLNPLLTLLSFIIVLSCVSSCANRDQTPRVDFTIDLTQQQYAVLDNTGGFLDINQVFVAKTVTGYVALSAYCTYDNSTSLEYFPSQDYIQCQACQSEYYSNGAVEFGRASYPLHAYATQLTGNLLRVYTP